MAPEMLKRMYSSTVDIWALGIIFYLMLSGGFFPFDGNPSAFFNRIEKDGLILKQEEWSHASKESQDLLTRML